MSPDPLVSACLLPLLKMMNAGDSSEDSIFLYDSIICGHYISKDIWTSHTFQPVV